MQGQRLSFGQEDPVLCIFFTMERKVDKEYFHSDFILAFLDSYLYWSYVKLNIRNNRRETEPTWWRE